VQDSELGFEGEGRRALLRIEDEVAVGRIPPLPPS
jgi:hypothetical protein